jgi:molybdopterin synthase sulfur carrier subunit
VPVVKLFAQAREAAGSSTVDAPGSTVDEVLAELGGRFGVAFAEVAAASRVWVNGEPAEGGTVVAEGDEVAILPPVSGG